MSFKKHKRVTCTSIEDDKSVMNCRNRIWWNGPNVNIFFIWNYIMKQISIKTSHSKHVLLLIAWFIAYLSSHIKWSLSISLIHKCSFVHRVYHSYVWSLLVSTKIQSCYLTGCCIWFITSHFSITHNGIVYNRLKTIWR